MAQKAPAHSAALTRPLHASKIVLRDLYVVAGWLSGLAGHVSLDLGDRSAAATHVRTVVQCAEISEHSPLRAWARSFQSLAAYWAGDYRRARDHAQAGQNEG